MVGTVCRVSRVWTEFLVEVKSLPKFGKPLKFKRMFPLKLVPTESQAKTERTVFPASMDGMAKMERMG
jgi:hypothetical protein